MLLAAINWHSVFFMIFATFACAFALGVLFAQNVVRMAFYLIVSLASTAALFMLAGAEFVGAMQIMIYVGGTLVLLIFGVMLTAQANFVSLKTRAGEWLLAAIFGGSLLVLLLQAAFSVPEWRSAPANQTQIAAADSKAATPIGLGLLGVRVDKLAEPDATRSAGMSGYLLPFELVSVHLLVVLVGAAYLARTKRRVSAE
jgi:NADH-quinone oxidoreductase subunit J